MREFHITSWERRELVGKGIIFLLTGFPVFYQISPCLIAPYFAFFLIGCALVFADSLEQRIVVSGTGVEYYGIGFALEANWKNVKKAGYDWISGDEGLYIDKSLIVAKTRYFNLKPYKGFRDTFVIPTSGFAENWRDAQLGQQIKQYAPHLFEKEKSMQSA